MEKASCLKDPMILCVPALECITHEYHKHFGYTPNVICVPVDMVAQAYSVLFGGGYQNGFQTNWRVQIERSLSPGSWGVYAELPALISQVEEK